MMRKDDSILEEVMPPKQITLKKTLEILYGTDSTKASSVRNNLLGIDSNRNTRS